MDEYFCPKCGAILNNQTGFNPNCGAWKCTMCGEMLMDGDIYDGDKYEGVAWFCDSCGVLLNKQDGFSDIYGSWICTECGYNNSITEDDIIDNNDDVAYKIGKTIGRGLVGVVSGILSSAINPNNNELENDNEDETYEDDENEEYNDNNEVNYIVQNENIENSKETKKRNSIAPCICFVFMMLLFVFFITTIM